MFQRITGRIVENSLGVAILAGLLSIPFTVALSRGLEPSTITGVPLVVTGALVGLVYSRRSGSTRRAGVQAGLVGALGVVFVQLSYVWSTVSTATGTETLLVLSSPVVVGIGVVLSVLLTTVSSILTGWVAGFVVSRSAVA